MNTRNLTLVAVVIVLALILPGASALVSAQTGYGRQVIYQWNDWASPMGIAIDQSGNYIVGEAGTRDTSRGSRISQITSAGAYTVIYASPYGPNASQIYDLAIDSDGNYVVAESWQQTVTRISSSNGDRLESFTLPGSLYWPLGIGIDSDGGYLVAVNDDWDYQAVWKVPALDGAAYTEIYTVSPEHRGPYDVVVNSVGDYIVTETGQGDGSLAGVLAKVSRSGHVRTEIYHFAAGTLPFGVAIDRDGSYIVCEHQSDILSRITPEGERTVLFEFDAGTRPARVAIDGDGSYIVTEAGKNVLSRIAPIAPQMFTITASAGVGGTITPSGAVSVNYGADQLFTIAPSAGYHVADVLVDGSSVGAVSSYTFTDVTADHIITVTFAKDSLPVVTTKDQCQNDGWQYVTRADGSPFKNQGDCIQYVNTGK